MYDNIKIILNERIRFISELYKRQEISEKQFINLNSRLLKIQDLMKEDKNLFSNVSIEIAYNILKDIGIPADNISNVYIEIMKEEINSKKRYTLIPPEMIK